ncbi:hypothetical protein [Streptomyces sp. NPDC057557]|uniref:hypothetical protein n=1 Tax=Streptomyces sp. NPDC057557 TaxID=3346167 RepID=UPI0036833481
MASNETDSTVIAAEGVQEIPATVRVVEEPAAADARAQLLAAIGAEAQLVAEKSAGQASAALVELAHAYALVIGGATVPTAITPTSRTLAPGVFVKELPSGVR